MGLALNYKEGQTPLEEEEQEGLRISTITTHKELDQFEQLNIEKAVEWSIHAKINRDQILTEKFIKRLHSKMFEDVWKWAGKFRQTEKNIGVKWIQIGLELKSLLDDTNYWIDNKTYPADEIAIRFKHRLVSIHCFPNGNGRHSRLMADLIVEKIFERELFTWHFSDMIEANDIREKYIYSLREADNGNINNLIAFARK